MTDSNFVTAWRKDTGEKVRIPARWVDHKVLGEPFTTTEPKGSTTEPSGSSAPRGAASATNKAADGAAKEK